MEIPFKPVANRSYRIGLFALLLPLPFASAGMMYKTYAAALFYFLVGSYRRTSFLDGQLRRQLVIAFFPLRQQQSSVERFVQIEIESEADQRAGWGVFFILGPYSWIIFRVSDYLVPWFGGFYRLSLRSAKGKRVLVWQGNSDDFFEENLELLKETTGLPVERKGL